jgi:hypothetical protein
MTSMRIHRLLLIVVAVCVMVPGLALWAAPAPTSTVVATPTAAPSSTVAKATPTAEAPPELVKLADEIAAEVESIRGWKFKKPVPKRVCDEKEVRLYLEKEFDREMPPRKLGVAQSFLTMVGLLPPNLDAKKAYLDLMGVQVAAFYDPDDKVLCMVRPEKAKPVTAMDRVIMSHELCHALDDQQLDLEKFVNDLSGKSEDGDLVVGSVAEGSASALMTQYMARMAVAGKLDLAEVLSYSKEEEAKNEAFIKAPPYFMATLGTYVCGMGFLARGNLMELAMGGGDIGGNLTAVIKDPPHSTEQIIHPEKYWDKGKRDEPVLVNDDDVLARLDFMAGADLRCVHKDTVGEMLCSILTRPKADKIDPMEIGMPAYWTNVAATGWGGDRFYLFAYGKTVDQAAEEAAKGKCKGLWITLWDTEKDRDEFIKAYNGISPNLKRETFKYGNFGAIFIYDFSDEFSRIIKDNLGTKPPRMTKDDKPWSAWAP